MSMQFNEFSVRPPTEIDIPAIVDLLNASSLEITGTQDSSVEDYGRMWRSPGYAAAQDSRIAITAEGQIVAVAHAYARAPYVSNFLWIAVHPAYRERGLGTYLTDWGETRVRERMPDAPADARVTVRSSTLSAYQPSAELLRNLGYQQVRSFYTMVIEMDALPPTPVWPPEITIQSMAPGQERAVYRADYEAFKDHWGYVEAPFEEGFQRWQYFVTSHAHYDPSVFFLAMDGAEIAGIALCFPKDNEFPDMAWVDDLGVRRPWRRQGLALALLHHAFGEFYRRGIKKVGLGVDASSLTGATRLYEKAGMRVLRQFDTYEKELRPGRDLTTQVAG
ncbi:MAG: GNAT family N-acetyltransferase [Caldilineaceae bacterium]